MNRRESRASMGAARQNDALFEFENFKKKFLLANKHITKLNSTLSVRIEELNAQISTLYVENLRLRASEIALTAQLKREREKSRKVMADAEAASQNLTKHLTYLRESYNIKDVVDTPLTPPSPRARRPVLDPNASLTSPQFRIARPPNVPGIYEDEEPSLSSSEENSKQTTPPRRKSNSKPRLSASKLPLPTRGPSPTPSTPQPPVSGNTDTATVYKPSKRKPSRRQSGLLTVNTELLSVPRSGSPAFGSPIRLEAGRAEEEEEFAAVHGTLEVEVLQPCIDETIVKKEKRKAKAKEPRESESEKDGTAETAVRPREKEKKRPREEDGSEAAKNKQKDVSVPRTALQPIDNNVVEQPEPVTQPQAASNRQFLRPASPSGSLPHSQDSSSLAPPNLSETDGASGGRERRTRKSVNYAEPKLNTKMRKPDPLDSGDPPRPKKRSSAAAVMSTAAYKSPDAMDVANEADVDTEARSSLEVAPSPPPSLSGPVPASAASFLLRSVNGDYINPELFPLPPSRPGSAAAMYSPGPPTRTTGSTISSTSTNATNATAPIASSSSPSQAIKRKKSRAQVLLSDSDSDGAEADAEYMGGRGSSGSGSGSGNWINVEGRRKALPKRNAAVVAVTAIEDIRRHSMAY